MDAGTNSPLVGSFVPGAESQLSQAEWRHLLGRVKLRGRTQVLQELTGGPRELMALEPARPMGGCGKTFTAWRRSG
jgi:hypothetical protein